MLTVDILVHSITPIQTPLKLMKLFAEMTFGLIQDDQGPIQRHVSANNLPQNWGRLIDEIWGYHPSVRTFICPIEILLLLTSTKNHCYSSTTTTW
jgi:hypothetical protein